MTSLSGASSPAPAPADEPEPEAHALALTRVALASLSVVGLVVALAALAATFAGSRKRREWCARAPGIRAAWAVAVGVGAVLSWGRRALGLPVGAGRAESARLEAEARRRAGADEPRDDGFADTFHRAALAVVPKALLRSDVRDFVFALPFAETLEKKLRVERAWARIPRKPLGSLEDVTTAVPVVFVVGLPRTGSTRFHQIAGLHPGLRVVRSWQFKFPVPLSTGPADLAERRQKTQAMLDFFYKMAPNIKRVHYVRADDPDECVQGFVDCALPENYLWGAVDAPEAYSWYVDGDMTQQYTNFRKLLDVVLESCDDGIHEPVSRAQMPLLLKSPHHTLKLPEICRAFPGAKFVWLHRDVCSSVGSCCSMNEAILDVVGSRFVDPFDVGRRTLKRLAAAVDKGMRDRDELEKQGLGTFVDVRYDEFKRDEVGVFVRALEQLGIPTSAADRAHLERVVGSSAAAPAAAGATSDSGASASLGRQESDVGSSTIPLLSQREGGGEKERASWKAHSYSLAHFGLDADAVRAAMSVYASRFGVV